MLLIDQVIFWSLFVFSLALGVCAGIGAVQCATTRSDAFEVAGRMSKGAWTAILGGCAAVFLLPIAGFPLGGNIFAIVAAVFTGIYWFDVRPQIKEILGNAGGW